MNSSFEGEPVEYVAHVVGDANGGDAVYFGYAANQADCRAQDAIHAAQSFSKVTSIMRAAVVKVVKSGGVKRMDKSSGKSKRASNSA